MEASGAGGFEPWEEPKIRALAAACFHRVAKVNQSAWNFSMLPLSGPNPCTWRGEGEEGGRARQREKRQKTRRQGKSRDPGKGGGQEEAGGGEGYGDT